MSLETPILFLTFNRPKQTEKVFAQIRNAKPTKLYFAIDGPRAGKIGEEDLCQQVKHIVLDNIDWNCEVKTLIRDKNLGCKQAVSSAITWFFEHEPEGIILEDDCLPDPSFFPYCAELLSKYRDDTRIMMISGDYFQKEKLRSDYSYYFTRYNQIWGWASWRRVWNLYDVEMKILPEILKNNYLFDILQDKTAVKKWEKAFLKVYEGKNDTWDYQFTLTCFIHGGLCINPNVNLISNIGYDENATHTSPDSFSLANLPVEPIQFPLKHPPYMIRDNVADTYDEKWIFHPNKLLKLKNRLSVFFK
jgi:hypothetical protein